MPYSLAHGRGDRGAADPHAAGEETLAFQIKEIAGLRTDVNQQDRLFRLAVGRAKRVVDRHRGDVHFRRADAVVVDRGVQLVERVVLDRDDEDFLLVPVVDQLVVPHHFVERKRNVLLGLEGDELLDVVILQRGQLDEAGENRLAGNRVTRLGLAHLEAAHELANRDLRLGNPGGVHRRIRHNGFRVVLLEDQSAVFRCFENRPC